jgi:ribosomal-protein-alanine N-acetyltransferase
MGKEMLSRKTQRLIIRPLVLSDFDAWQVSFSTMRPQQNKWDQENRPKTELTKSNFRKILKSQKTLRERDQFYDLAVFEKKSGELIGNVAAMDVLRGLGQSAYLGYFMHNRYWGKGYGKEATLAMIDIAFRDIKLHRIEAGIEPSNRRSILLARSIGLRKEGLKKRAV